MTEHQHESGVRPVSRRIDSGEEERRHAEDEISSRLLDRGVRLTGRETGDELADLLDAVERFEVAVENSGGDLMIDEPVGAESPIAPDDSAFVLPKRNDGESVTEYIARIAVATSLARGKGE